MVFRRLAANWFRRSATEAIREKAVEAAREGLADAARASQTGQPTRRQRPCDVGVVFALGIEAGGLEDLLDGAIRTRGHGFSLRQGGLKGRHVVVVRSGPGRNAARHATEALLSGHKPHWVISAGFAGGLTPELKHYDLVMADSLVDTAGQRLSIDLKVDPEWLVRASGVHVGRLVTIDRIVRLPAQKRELGEKHQALAADMETFAVAETCRQRQVRFLAVRIVGDAVDEDLAPEVERLLRQTTRPAKFGAVLGAVWRRPSSVKDLWKLKESALTASGRLARFLSSIIEQLAPLRPAGD